MGTSLKSWGGPPNWKDQGGLKTIQAHELLQEEAQKAEKKKL